MPNLRDKTWTPTTPAQTADAQFWEDHLIDDASYEGLQEILEGGGGGGHVIQNPSGTEMPQQPVLQFITATVTNGEGKTIVSGNGEKGDAATVAVGTVTTGAAGTNAQVTNSGTQYDAVLDFVIPRGADGNGLPSGGSNGQVLYKDTSASTGGAWGDLPDSVLSVNGETPDAQGNVDIVALPTGGTAGQVLTKDSATDGDASWQTKEVILTQAEYDALPSSKLTDGVSYYITDGESAPSTNRFSASGVTYGSGSVADKLDLLNGQIKTVTSGSLNSLTASGIYYCTSAVTDAPINGGGVLVVGAYNSETASATYISYGTAGAVAFGRRNASGWTWARTPNLTAVTISGTTTSTGAIEVPTEHRTKVFVTAVMTSQSGFVFRRDISYFTVMSNDLNSAVANTAVTFTAYFLEV